MALADVQVIGVVPKGLAPFSNFFAVLDASAVGALLQGAFGIAIVGFMETVAMSTQGVCSAVPHFRDCHYTTRLTFQ